MPDTNSIYPTEWHLIDVIEGTECRQLTDDTYELQSVQGTVIVNKEGFDKYREGNVEFNQWLKDNNISINTRVK